jgi:hypothetical protein
MMRRTNRSPAATNKQISLNSLANHAVTLIHRSASTLMYACTSAAHLQASDLKAKFHCCYDDRVLDMSDDNDKYMDFPAFLGGSGIKFATLPVPLDDDESDTQLVHTGSSDKSRDSTRKR